MYSQALGQTCRNPILPKAGASRKAQARRAFARSAVPAALGTNPLKWRKNLFSSSRVAHEASEKRIVRTNSYSGSSSTQQLKEEKVAPLKQALEAAIARHTKAQGVRASLEAEVCALFERLVSADKQEAEEVAAAAMRAVEEAVKDEAEAAAVVSATRSALEETLSELALIDSTLATKSYGESNGEVSSWEARMKAEEAASNALKLTNNGRSSAELLAETAPPYEEKPAASEQDGTTRMVLGALAGAAGFYILTQTPPGEALMGAVGQVGQFLSDKFGPFHIGHNEESILVTCWLLLTSLICVPLVCKCIPGGNPVLGYLLGGAILGPHALGIVHDVEHVRHLAELGVVFLLFNIGLELSLERLQAMAKFVFGMGTAQVVLTLLGVAAFATTLGGLGGPAAIILGGALAMSTTAVGIQVLEDRGEMGSRHGRATFSVLLLQDLAVVVLLMLIPLLAPSPDGSAVGLATIAQALVIAGFKAVVCIVGIVAGGRLFVRPLYKFIAKLGNAEMFVAATLLMALGTSMLTLLAGLSLALGAFLAGLLIAETEYAMQVESDIAPYKGLFLGLFFMTVGMEISAALFMEKWQEILFALVVLIVGKLAVMAGLGPAFGLSRMTAVRSGLLLSPGGEFAFVAFGEAISKGVLTMQTCAPLYMTVALSMAMTPYLAEVGGIIGKMFESGDVAAMKPEESDAKDLHNHVIIAGYGRAGQIVAQMCSEQLIPFVALDVSTDRVQAGRSLDLPVYFGDAGSEKVMHHLHAEHAACAVICLDSPGANYRAVWALKKHYPDLKVFVRAHDVSHGLNLERAGATAVVPEMMEPALQLAGAVLYEFDKQPEEVNVILDDFRKDHLSALKELAAVSGTTVGYGYSRNLTDGEKVSTRELTPALQ